MEKIVNLKVASLTHMGYVRERNEDALFVSPDERVFTVADGMGGMSAGDLASRLSVTAVSDLCKSNPPDFTKADALKSWVIEAIDNANSQVVKESFNQVLDMGTTIVVAALGPEGLLVFGHLGDSRLYTTSSGCLTEDHAIGAHELTNFVGRSLSSNPDIAATKCEPGTRVLLCTDGLNKVVSDEEIMEIMLDSQNGPESILEMLMDLALGYGGPDNITMICLEIL
jgi:protein phosphatase